MNNFYLPKKILKSIVEKFFYYKLFIPISLSFIKSDVVILNFHSIFLSHNNFQNNQIEFKQFVKLIEEFDKYFEFIDINNIYESYSSNKIKLILSFDDGFSDFLELFEIFQKYKIKPNLNIIVNSILTDYVPLNMLAQSIINQLSQIDLNLIDFPEINKSLIKNIKNTKSQFISNYYKYLKTDKQLEINNYLKYQINKFDNVILPKFMNLEDLNSISNITDLGVSNI